MCKFIYWQIDTGNSRLWYCFISIKLINTIRFLKKYTKNVERKILSRFNIVHCSDIVCVFHCQRECSRTLTSSSKSIYFFDNYLTLSIWWNEGLKTLLYSMKTQAIWSFECCWSTFKKYYLTPHNFYSWPILIYNFIPRIM